MMMDGKGLALTVGVLAAIGMILGLLLNWVGLLPWWAPLVGALLPAALAALLFIYLIISWMADGSH